MAYAFRIAHLCLQVFSVNVVFRVIRKQTASRKPSRFKNDSVFRSHLQQSLHVSFVFLGDKDMLKQVSQQIRTAPSFVLHRCRVVALPSIYLRLADLPSCSLQTLVTMGLSTILLSADNSYVKYQKYHCYMDAMSSCLSSMGILCDAILSQRYMLQETRSPRFSYYRKHLHGRIRSCRERPLFCFFMKILLKQPPLPVRAVC